MMYCNIKGWELLAILLPCVVLEVLKTPKYQDSFHAAVGVSRPPWHNLKLILYWIKDGGEDCKEVGTIEK